MDWDFLTIDTTQSSFWVTRLPAYAKQKSFSAIKKGCFRVIHSFVILQHQWNGLDMYNSFLFYKWRQLRQMIKKSNLHFGLWGKKKKIHSKSISLWNYCIKIARCCLLSDINEAKNKTDCLNIVSFDCFFQITKKHIFLTL